MKQQINLGLASLLFLVGASQQFFINDLLVTALLATLVLALVFWQRADKPTRVISLVLMAISWLGALLSSLTLTFAAGLGLVAFGLYLLVSSAIALWKGKGNLLIKLLATGLSLVALLPALAVSYVTIFPGPTFVYLRSAMKMTPDTIDTVQKEGQTPTGDRVLSNIQYDSQADNGYLDIYYTSKATSDKPKTLIYVHGGGYLWGDKVGGDPNAGKNGFEFSPIAIMLEDGYNVVSMNYALTPSNPFPTAIKQLNRGLAYLKDHASDYQLNMDEVVLLGGSAGGNLVGLLTNIQTNPAYAQDLGVTASLAPDTIKAIVFVGGLFNNGQFQETRSALIDWAFYQMGRLYLETNDVKKSPQLAISNVTDYVTADFPPTFISDGNTATFDAQAFAFEKQLTALGVTNELSYYSVEEAGSLGHSFEESGSEYAIKTFDKIKAFLRQVTQ